MKYYRLQAKGFHRLRRKVLLFFLPLLLISLCIAFALMYAYMGANDGDAFFRSLMFTIPTLILASVVAFWLSISRVRVSWNSYRLILNDGEIVREQEGVPPVEIWREDVTQISEYPQGLHVRSVSSEFFIPKELEEYHDVRKQLELWRSIEQAPSKLGRTLFIQYAASLGLVIAFLGFFILENPILVLTLGVALTGVFIFCFVLIQRSEHIDRRVKWGMFLVVFPIISIALKVAVTLFWPDL